MADFFEEFGRMVSDVASDITKKTGDTLEIQKIKSNVRSLKRANEREKEKERKKKKKKRERKRERERERKKGREIYF